MSWVVVYRLLMRICAPFILGITYWHQILGRAVPGGVSERLGYIAPQQAGAIWIHGASLGELTSARWVIDLLQGARPDLPVMITCNSASGRQMVLNWGLPRSTVHLAPLDLAGALRRFIRATQPSALIILENELWPERVNACAAADITVMLLGARLSARSAQRWQKWAPGLLRGMLGQVAFASPQDSATAARLVDLGLPQQKLGPQLMLKAHHAAHGQRPPPFAPPYARSRTVLAASTHEGEDAILLDAFAIARKKGQLDHLILAPRHPQRGPAIAALIADKGLSFATRSKGDQPGKAAVYLADTLGDMDHWYQMAGITIIGGTFVEKGGHTPFEPALYGTALVHGPSIFNFSEAFPLLDGNGGAVAATADTLADTLECLTPERQIKMAATAMAVLQAQDGDPTAVLAAILALIPSSGPSSL